MAPVAAHRDPRRRDARRAPGGARLRSRARRRGRPLRAPSGDRRLAAAPVATSRPVACATAPAASTPAGSHLPFIAVALADVEVMKGGTATLPFRIEGAHGGGATVRIVISTAGGATVKTIVVARTVRSGADAKHVVRLPSQARHVHLDGAGHRRAAAGPPRSCAPPTSPSSPSIRPRPTSTARSPGSGSARA